MPVTKLDTAQSCQNHSHFFIEPHLDILSPADDLNILTISVGVAIAMVLFLVLVVVIPVAVCCCCIPGCLLHSTRRQRTAYQTIY